VHFQKQFPCDKYSDIIKFPCITGKRKLTFSNISQIKFKLQISLTDYLLQNIFCIRINRPINSNGLSLPLVAPKKHCSLGELNVHHSHHKIPLPEQITSWLNLFHSMRTCFHKV
jgi:hypothetical protein